MVDDGVDGELGVVGGDLADDAAVGEDQQPVGDGQDLLELGGGDDDGGALLGEPDERGEHLGLGADVDPAGGLVDEEDVGPVAGPLGQQQLLLVAAGEIDDVLLPRRRAHLEPGDEAIRKSCFLAKLENAEGGHVPA